MSERYQLTRQLGSQCSLAQDQRLHRWVIVKQGGTAAEIEIGKTASAFRPRLLDLTEQDAMVFEYCTWPTLATYLKQPRLDPTWVKQTSRQLIRAVKDLHAQGWVHCDLNPTNILVSPQGLVWLIDFGAATREGERSGQYHPDWAAPEQLAHQRVTAASDLYTLGRVLLSLAHRTRGFSKPWQRVLRQTQHQRPERRPTLSEYGPTNRRPSPLWPVLAALVALPAWAPEDGLSLRDSIRLGAGELRQSFDVAPAPGLPAHLTNAHTNLIMPARQPADSAWADPTAHPRLEPRAPFGPASTKGSGLSALTTKNTDS